MLVALAAHGDGAAAREEVRARYEERHPPSASDFGGVGLLQTRTARFGRDGQFDVGVAAIAPYRRYYLSLIALPGVEATFRYTDVRNRAFFTSSPSFTSQSYKDRGGDLKVRIIDETRWFPALAVGVQDGIGTGLFDGEYVVASKRYGDFDFSLGLGWGISARPETSRTLSCGSRTRFAPARTLRARVDGSRPAAISPATAPLCSEASSMRPRSKA